MNKRVLLVFSSLITLTLLSSLVLAYDSDLNDDGIVDIRDLSIIATSYRSKPGDPNWNPKADLDGNERIDINDVNIVASNYKKEIPTESRPSGTSLSFSGIISWFKNLFSASVTESSPKTEIYVDPIRIVDSRLNSGKTFTVDLNMYDVIDLFGFDVKISYNPSVLKHIDYKVTNFLNGEIIEIGPYEDDDYIEIVAASSGHIYGRTGSGTIANITFQVIGSGESNLDFSYAMFASFNPDTDIVQEIKNVILNDGYFNNKDGIQYSKMIPSSGSINY